MWSAINLNSQDSKRLSNLKKLKLVPIQPNESHVDSDQSSATDPSTTPLTWRKELRLTTVVERQRKKLSTATASSSSTTTSSSHSSSRGPLTPFDLPRLDHRLSDLDEKLEVIEHMMSARQQLFQVLSKDSNLLNCDLQKELQRNSLSYQLPQSSSSQAAEETSGTTQDLCQPKPSQPTEQSEDTLPTSNQPTVSNVTEGLSESALGWGEYFKKKLW